MISKFGNKHTSIAVSFKSIKLAILRKLPGKKPLYVLKVAMQTLQNKM